MWVSRWLQILLCLLSSLCCILPEMMLSKNHVIFVATVSWLFYSSFSEIYGWKIFCKKVSLCRCRPPKRHISRTFPVSWNLLVLLELKEINIRNRDEIQIYCSYLNTLVRTKCIFSTPNWGEKHPCPLSVDVPLSQVPQFSWCNIC